jgi:predicted GNAT family acetyltransferase
MLVVSCHESHLMDRITYKRDLDGIDWQGLKALLTADDFDNGRTAEQLRLSFANSFAVCFAMLDDQIIGKARVLSDGVCNAYMVDVWTHTPHRRQGIASEMILRLTGELQGQHVYLQADADVVPFYRKLGFGEQPCGLALVVGHWLKAEP